MKYRAAFVAPAALLLSSLAGCDDGGDHGHEGHSKSDSQIVFGIDQTKGAD